LGRPQLDWTADTSASWFNANAASGSLSSGGLTTVTVTINAGTAGIYNDILTITSNEPDSPSIQVPIELTVTALPDCGELSGIIIQETWTAPCYNITDDIYIVSLVIEPGVTLFLQGDYLFEVGGSLSAVGTQDNQILFTRSSPGWQGIYLNHTPDENQLAHLRIEKATNSGMRMVGSQATLNNCTFSNNSASYGGAINANGVDSLTISDCFLSNNSATQGGAIYVAGASSDVLIEKKESLYQQHGVRRA
jgi:predicted outer membrane repeat protein